MLQILDNHRKTIVGAGIVIGFAITVGATFTMWKTDRKEVVFIAATTLMATGLYLMISSIDIYYRT